VTFSTVKPETRQTVTGGANSLLAIWQKQKAPGPHGYKTKAAGFEGPAAS
jgi:hypothetical protein